jgi:hypothetical protein
MVFPASQAKIFTDQNIIATAASQVQIEITLCEQKIRFATRQNLYEILYDAKTIGNPKGPPQDPSNLTDNQETFYTLLVNVGYVVGRDTGTGRWSISWAPVGPESLVNVYSFRTSVLPGAIYLQTIAAIQSFFSGQTPTIHSVVTVVQDGSGNQIQQSDFGATDSTFYEYTAVVDQEFDTTDYSASLKIHLTAQGLGYNTGNCQVYKII